MNETNLIIQNRLREATVSLERANLIICDETWKCDSSVPPFSSIQLVLQGEGTICIDETTIHPTSGQLYLLPAYTNQAFFTDIHNPYRTYYCHFEITRQQTDLFELIHLPLCIDAKDPKKAEQLFLDLVHSVRQDDIFSAMKAKQAVLNLLCYYLAVSYTHLDVYKRQLLGFASIGALFSGNIVVGVVIFVLFIMIGYLGGFFVAFVGLCRFFMLLKKRKGNS